jgi:hypothetical protein
MTSRVAHRLSGYDRDTELLAVEFDIPARAFSKVKKIVRIGSDDPDAIGSYPLDRTQVGKISTFIDADVDVERFDYFVEAFSKG